ncbi:MAG: thioredoxin family protein [bacterium]
MKKAAIFILIILIGFSLFQNPAEAKAKKPLITFIELGSVNCIPCKKMQPVMKSIENKYGSQIEVIFYDVWKDEFKSKVEEYKIKLIPTQVFLDQNGKEIDRHEGFYPEEQMDKFLQSKGLKIKKGKKK